MITVSGKLRPLESQGFLFPELRGREFTTEAEKRVFFGEAAERIAEGCIGAMLGKRVSKIMIDGRVQLCPDLAILEDGKPMGYVEVKSCGKTRQVILYEWRHKKEVEFVEQSGMPYLYCVVSHKVTGEGVADWMGLLHAFSESPIGVHVIDLSELTDLIIPMGAARNINGCYERNHAHGCWRTGYAGGGWRVRLSGISGEETVARSVAVDGVTIALQTSVSMRVRAKLQNNR